MSFALTTSRWKYGINTFVICGIFIGLASTNATDLDQETTAQKDPGAQGVDRADAPKLPRDKVIPPDAIPTGEKRTIPDYDGRRPEQASAAEVLIWIPRGLFLPVRVGVEYLVRRPLVFGLAVLEEYRILDKVESMFTWADGKVGIFPTAFYEFGISPSVGFYAFYEDPYGPGSKQILRGGFWDDKQQLALENRISVFKDNGGSLYTKGLFSHRPDHPFYGVGPTTRESYRGNFGMLKTELVCGLESVIENLNRIHFFVSYRYTDHTGGGSPSIQTLFPVENQNIVPGWGDYHLVNAMARLEIDSRSPFRELTAGTGMRLDFRVSYSVDPSDTDLRFLQWGGDLAGFLDLSGYNHVVGLRLYTAFIEQQGSREVPFTELVHLGGLEYMPAFHEGRFRGKSGALLALDYRYPIWAYLDAELFAGLGNTFGKHLEGFAWDRMFLSFGIGVRSNHSRDVSFDVLLTFGSNRLDSETFEIDRVGFAIGINQGF